MRIENSNSDIYVLVLARPADSICTILTSALCQWRHIFSMYSTAYEVVNGIKDIPAGQLPVLIVRPAMLGSQAASFLERQFPSLRIIGWLDSGERVSDCAIAQTMANGMVMTSHLDQLQQIIHSFRKKNIPQNQSLPNEVRAVFPEKLDRLEYELSNDEVHALLEVQ